MTTIVKPGIGRQTTLNARTQDAPVSREKMRGALFPGLMRLTATGLLLGGFLGGAAFAQESKTFTFSGDKLAVANLIGSVEVVQGSGRDFTVLAHVRGKDAAKANIGFMQKQGAVSKLVVEFPVERTKRFVYPEMNGNTTIRHRGDRSSLLSRLLGAIGSDSIKVSGRGSGVQVWVDLVIEVPNDSKTLTVENGVGDLVASGVVGDLVLRSQSGRMTGTDLIGDSTFDLGSGSVRLSGVQGDLTVDTGSGSVALDRFEGPDLSIDTGSGRVQLSEVRTRELSVDTGSGGVSADRVACEEATIDTGSGHVRLALSEMGAGQFSIDTGSGGITLLLPDYASASVNAATGSGGVNVALDGVKLLHRERNEMRFEVGKGDAQVDLDTGSGAIKIAALEP